VGTDIPQTRPERSTRENLERRGPLRPASWGHNRPDCRSGQLLGLSAHAIVARGNPRSPTRLVRTFEEESGLYLSGQRVNRGLPLFIVAGLCGVVVAACGSSSSTTTSSSSPSSSSPSSSSTPAGTTAKPTGKPIALGAIVTETGPVASGGGYEYAANVANAWAAWVNATGGVNGHPVTMTVLDDAATPATEESDARRLVEQEHVAAVFIEDQSASAVAPYLASQNVPLFSSLGDGGHTQATATWFGVDMGPPYSPLDFVQVDKAAGATKFSNAVCSEVAVCLAYGKQLAAFGPKIGMQPGVTTTIAETATNATAQCLAITASHSDAINMFIGTNPISLIANACKTQGYKGIFVTASLVDVTFDTVKIPMTLTAHSFPWWADNAPAVQFRQVMEKYGAGKDYKSVNATGIWALLQVFSYGMKAKGPAAGSAVTGKDVISAMQQGVKSVTLGGLLPQPITFSPTGSTVVRCFWPGQYKDGVYSTLQGAGASGNGATAGLRSDCLPVNAAG